MILKHLQLNTSRLKAPRDVAEFIVKEEIDVACLQEIVYPIDGENPLKPLVEEKGFNYFQGVNFYYIPANQVVAEAIVSKFKIKDYYIHFYNSLEHEPKSIRTEDMLGELIQDNSSISISGSRGIKHAVKSRCIVTVVLETPNSDLRVITTHYSVSDLCTETIQMLEMSKIISSHVKYSKAIPTIFSGDSNIRATSYSIKKLSEVMVCHTIDIKDTLSINHESKNKDFPEGLAIDHVFSKNITHKSTEALEVRFSDHKAIISNFSI